MYKVQHTLQYTCSGTTAHSERNSSMQCSGTEAEQRRGETCKVELDVVNIRCGEHHGTDRTDLTDYRCIKYSRYCSTGAVEQQHTERGTAA